MAQVPISLTLTASDASTGDLVQFTVRPDAHGVVVEFPQAVVDVVLDFDQGCLRIYSCERDTDIAERHFETSLRLNELPGLASS